MTAPSCHVGLDRLRADARGVTAVCRDLGMRTIFAPAPPIGERDGGEAEWRALGTELAALGRIVNAEGARFRLAQSQLGIPQGGGRPLLSRPDVRAGAGPRLAGGSRLDRPRRRRSGGRAQAAPQPRRLLHIKDIAAPGECLDEDGWADPGHGVLDWAALRALIDEIGVPLLVVEHDKPNDVARFARRAAETVASWA